MFESTPKESMPSRRDANVGSYSVTSVTLLCGADSVWYKCP